MTRGPTAIASHPAIGGRLRRQNDGQALAAALVIAAAIHVGIAGGASATHLFSGWGGLGPSKSAPPQPAAAVRPLKPSCDADAILAVAARSLTCVSPFVDGVDACVAELSARLESDRLHCHVEDIDPVAFTLQPFDAKQIAQIDPEPLLETLSPESQEKFEKKQEELDRKSVV